MTGKRQQHDPGESPSVAIRRHTDRCFHAVEEVVYESPPGEREGEGSGVVAGYIIDGVMIDADDVAEVRHLPDGGDRPACR